MRVARIYNDHRDYGDKDYSEVFRDEKITVPAGKFVEMDPSDAVQFLGQYVPTKRLDNGDYINPKALRMVVVHICKEKTCKKEFVNDELLKDHLRNEHRIHAKDAVNHRCHVCKKDFRTEGELVDHGIDAHAELLVKDEEEEVSRRKK